MVAAGACPAARTQAAHCDVRATRAALCHFVAALDNGAASRFLAPARQFERYTVGGPAGIDARDRATLLTYLSDRSLQTEHLQLTWFSFTRSARGIASFRVDAVRSADDIPVPTLYRGTAKLICAARCRLASLAMAPNTEPSVPAPQTYADTCRLVNTWCQIEPTLGGVPDELRRPLSLPTIRPGDECPVTMAGNEIANGQVTGFALGKPPVQPLIFGQQPLLRQGTIFFNAVGSRGWYTAATKWIGWPEYRGPVLIRGRQLDGPHKIVMESIVDPQLGPGDTINGRDGWRQWPGGTYLRTPGCYAWQVDGTNFSTVIVFQAVFR